MGITYVLANWTRREKLSFFGFTDGKADVLVANPIVGALVCEYLMQCPGDLITFVSHDFVEWPFPGGRWEDLRSYPNVVQPLIDSLIERGVLMLLPITDDQRDDPPRLWERLYHTVSSHAWNTARQSDHPFPGRWRSKRELEAERAARLAPGNEEAHGD